MYIGNFSLARWSYLLFSVLFILSNTISTLPLIYDILNTVPESSKGLFNILFHFLKFDVNYEVSQNPMPFFLHKAYISMNILICLTIILQTYMNGVSRFINILLFIVSIYFIVSLMYLASIPNIILLGLGLIYVVFSSKFQIHLRLLTALSLIILSLFCGIKFQNGSDFKRGVNFFSSILSDNLVKLDDPRKETFEASIRVGLQNPFFGVGIGDVQDKLQQAYKTKYDLSTLGKDNVNLIDYSEDFNFDSWYKAGLHPYLDESTLGPLLKGHVRAIAIDTAYGAHHIYQIQHFEKEKKYTLSAFAKRKDTGFLTLRIGNIAAGRANFCLSDGKVSYKGMDILKISSTQIGHDWFRFSLTIIPKKQKELCLVGYSTSPLDYNSKGIENDKFYTWGIQLEEGELKPYGQSEGELLKYAMDNNLNSHNTYLYIWLSGGIICLIFFIIVLYRMFYIGYFVKSFLVISSTLIFAVNFLSENILLRQYGMMMFTIIIIITISSQQYYWKNLNASG
ncbi:MAG: hypothetical protein CL868_07090 [Cytophagaceae bacterium]|nr:hypothetical protein [Cytophagaceae bacterium]|tara:strand:- start:51280 stop:52806 length:1527 start_codon:yes stop_codon:yes gene_type:complete